jgi:hypothetical protein
MAITLTTPVVVAATEEKTFDEVWLSEFHVDARNPNGKVALKATMYPARTTVGESKELSGVGRKEITMPDFFAVATPEEIVLMLSIVTAIKNRAEL